MALTQLSMTSPKNPGTTEPCAPAALDSMKTIKPSACIGASIVAALFAIAFRVPLVWMYQRWTAEESYYSHGFLVPFVALYFVWRDRAALFAQPARPSMLGLAMFVAGLIVLLAS